MLEKARSVPPRSHAYEKERAAISWLAKGSRIVVWVAALLLVAASFLSGNLGLLLIAFTIGLPGIFLIRAIEYGVLMLSDIADGQRINPDD